MTTDPVEMLVCSHCRGELRFEGSRSGAQLGDGVLRCTDCAHAWTVVDGLPRMVEDEEVRGLDRIQRLVYDTFAVFHDPAVELLLPVLQLEGVDRNRYIRRLELDLLRPVRGRPVRILEVGVGGGANLPLIAAALPAGLDVELWGVDLSTGMLARCRRRIARQPPPMPVQLAIADAHSLPFRDGGFDRVFHTGAINAYNDPRRGLAEMARVAKPGTPIVVLDEELDPTREHGLYPRLMFRLLTAADPSPRAPVALLPRGAIDVLHEPASRFYYCLRFRMPGAVKSGRERRGVTRRPDSGSAGRAPRAAPTRRIF